MSQIADKKSVQKSNLTVPGHCATCFEILKCYAYFAEMYVSKYRIFKEI